MEKRIYWSLLALLLILFGWFGLRATPLAITAQWIELVHFNRLVFIVVLCASMPATLALMIPLRLLLGLGRGGRVFWIKDPAQTVSHETDLTLPAALEGVRQRLQKNGFEIQNESMAPGKVTLLLRKNKAERVTGFMEHGFQGEVVVQSKGGRTQVEIVLVFNDTLVIDSGEMSRLDALGAHLAGATESVEVATTPFTMVCGVVIVMAHLVLLSLPNTHAWVSVHSAAFSWAAIGMILFGGYPILSKPKVNYGLPLGLLAGVGAVAGFLFG